MSMFNDIVYLILFASAFSWFFKRLKRKRENKILDDINLRLEKLTTQDLPEGHTRNVEEIEEYKKWHEKDNPLRLYSRAMVKYIGRKKELSVIRQQCVALARVMVEIMKENNERNQAVFMRINFGDNFSAKELERFEEAHKKKRALFDPVLRQLILEINEKLNTKK